MTEQDRTEPQKSMNIPVPILTKQNYLGWSFDMRVFLDYHGLLTVVEQGLPPIVTKKKATHADFENKDKKALDFIHQGVHIDEIFDKIADATTSKQAWDNTLMFGPSVKFNCTSGPKTMSYNTRTASDFNGKCINGTKTALKNGFETKVHLENMIQNMVTPKPKQPNDPEKLARYNKTLAYLSAPQCSRTLIYEPHLVTLANNKSATATKPPPKSKKATPKKIGQKFLANVKILTASGMLDGVAVKYVSKTKKIELPGKIQGPSYLCGCQSCNYSKMINAYEFELHAGNKTSHPNNHIRFENGNSVHMVVNELNRTLDTNLFDALQTLTGSSIDHKAFSAWKGSF